MNDVADGVDAAEGCAVDPLDPAPLTPRDHLCEDLGGGRLAGTRRADEVEVPGVPPQLGRRLEFPAHVVAERHVL